MSFGLFGKGTEFFPETEPKRAYVNIKAPEGTNLDTSDKLVAEVEKIVSEYEDIRYVISNIGALGGDPFSQGGTGTHISRVVLDFKDFHDRSRSSSEIVNEVRQRILATMKGAEIQVEKEEEGPPTGQADQHRNLRREYSDPGGTGRPGAQRNQNHSRSGGFERQFCQRQAGNPGTGGQGKGRLAGPGHLHDRLHGQSRHQRGQGRCLPRRQG